MPAREQQVEVVTYLSQKSVQACENSNVSGKLYFSITVARARFSAANIQHRPEAFWLVTLCSFGTFWEYLRVPARVCCSCVGAVVFFTPRVYVSKVMCAHSKRAFLGILARRLVW